MQLLSASPPSIAIRYRTLLYGQLPDGRRLQIPSTRPCHVFFLNQQPAVRTPYHCSILVPMSVAVLARIMMHGLLPGLGT